MAVKQLIFNEYVDGKFGADSEHRRIYEDAYGPVPKHWHVHHVNELKADNRLENLIALPSEFHEWLHGLSLGARYDAQNFNRSIYSNAVRCGVIDKNFIQWLYREYDQGRLSLRTRLLTVLLSLLAKCLLSMNLQDVKLDFGSGTHTKIKN